MSNINNRFKGCTSFNTDISKWDVSNVINMTSMFQPSIEDIEAEKMRIKKELRAERLKELLK